MYLSKKFKYRFTIQGLLYFIKKNKCEFLHRLDITIVYLMNKKEETKQITENHVQSHPVSICLPCNLLGPVSKGKSHDHLLQINLKASHHHPASSRHHPNVTSTSKLSVSSLPVLGDAKAFQRKAKHHQNIFTMLMLHQLHLYVIDVVQVQCRSLF